MSYRVFWSPTAEQQLEIILKQDDDAGRLAALANKIDEQLVQDPNKFGESRYENVRVGFLRPLGVQFEILEDVRTAVVFAVWKVRKKRR